MINFNSGKYTQLEIFSKAQSDGPAFLTLNPSNQMQTAGISRHKRLIFTLEPNTSYSLELTNASMDWAYLCGNEDIFETGIQYWNRTDQHTLKCPAHLILPFASSIISRLIKIGLTIPMACAITKGIITYFISKIPLIKNGIPCIGDMPAAAISSTGSIFLSPWSLSRNYLSQVYSREEHIPAARCLLPTRYYFISPATLSLPMIPSGL